ncbi:MAG: peptidyl-alpha-hydroxyglycine alpha-amidating lyase family protein [Vicinamibacterales bacterium]
MRRSTPTDAATENRRAARHALVVVGLAVLGAAAGGQALPRDPSSLGLPNPNPTVVRGWGELPAGRTWGSSAAVDIGPDGEVWTYDRCGGNSCEGSALDPILKFDHRNGKLLAAFGAGLLVFPHGLHVDGEGNVWVTDARANSAGTKGHQVLKFSPDGTLLMALGKPGVPGNTRDTFNEPCDVITAPNGDIYVADGHSGQRIEDPTLNARIVKFDKSGRYLREWGRFGRGRGEFRTPHALAFDSRGRLFVADRGNSRIQIFDPDGRFLEEWEQFGRVSDLFIDRQDNLFAIDSESGTPRNPGWSTGVRIGTAHANKVLAFIPPHRTAQAWGAAGEGVAVDSEGSVYAAEGPQSRDVAGGGITKYAKR